MEEKKVFLSVGRTSTPQQEEFVRQVERYLEANGLVPRTVGRNDFSSTQPLKRVGELMEQCSGAVIIALERTYIEAGLERRGTTGQHALGGCVLPTVWNQIEAGMAYVHDHPLLVIVEDSVKKEGLLEEGYDWYVQRVRIGEHVLDTAEFAGVFADWKRRVEQRSVPNRRRPRREPASPEKLTLGEIVSSMTPAQLWATTTALAVALAAVAGVAFRMGQYAGLGH